MSDDLAAKYGFAAQTLMENPELRALMYEAITRGDYDPETGEWVDEPMTVEEFQARVKETAWYAKKTQG